VLVVAASFAFLPSVLPAARADEAFPFTHMILVPEFSGAAGAALEQAGYTWCGNGTDDRCFVQVSPEAFRTISFTNVSVIYVGTLVEDMPGIEVLMERAGDIDAFVRAGGSVVASMETANPAYHWVPDGGQILQGPTTNLDLVELTGTGAAHAALAGQSDESLSDWHPSAPFTFVSAPSYLEVLATDAAPHAEPVYLAGKLDAGCVFVTAAPVDFVSVGVWGATDDGREAAKSVVVSSVGWGLDCVPEPVDVVDTTTEAIERTPFTGGADVTWSGSGTPAVTSAFPEVECDPILWDGWAFKLTCRPNTAPPMGFEWGCRGPMVFAQFSGAGAFTASVDCGGLPTARCTADGTTGNMCFETSGADALGSFDVTCRGRVRVGSLITQWSVHCAFPDP